jgi:hypothetical protein
MPFEHVEDTGISSDGVFQGLLNDLPQWDLPIYGQAAQIIE